MKKTNLKHLDLELYEETLDNGLSIYIVPKKNFNNIYVTFTTKFGSNEIEFTTKSKMTKVPLGVAHFLEHKLFEQKDGIDPFTFYNERGCDCNANTNQYKTTYLFSGPNYFEENLNYLIDYVQEPYFTDENVKKEKGIIKQEIKMDLDDPETVMYEKILENCFVNHPMKYPIIGTIKTINEITKEDLYSCYEAFYNPSNMFITITGNVDPNLAIKIIKENQKKKKFKEIKEIKIKKYNEPKEVARQKEVIKLNISIPEFILAYKIPLKCNYKSIIYTLTLFDCKLGSTSKFCEQLINDEIINEPLAIDYNIVDDYLIIFVCAMTEYADEVINRINTEMKFLKVDENDFIRKKKTLISSLVYLSDNIFRLNHNIINDIIFYKKFNTKRYDDILSLNFNDFNKLISSLDLSNTSLLIGIKNN